jgi:hypothetical protein
MKMDDAGNIYVTGTRSMNEWSVFTTVKYSQTLVDVKEATPLTFALEQNYPNPFNPTTTIRYSLPSQSINSAQGRAGVGSYVTLKVYDVLGREVATLVNEMKQPGRYTVQFDGSGLASGVYFYRLSTTNFVQTRKLLSLK